MSENNAFYSSENDMVFNKDKTMLLSITPGIKDIVVPDTVEVIHRKAFSGYDIKSVRLPNKIKNLSSEFFDECEMLETVVLPENLIGIGDYAFRRCISLKRLSIPDSVSHIGESAFDRITLEIGNNPYAVNYAKSNGLKYTLRND